MYVYIHIYMYTYIHVYVYTYVHIYIYICTYIHMYIYTYIYIHTYIHIYTYVCVCVCVCVCVSVCVFVCVCVYIYNMLSITRTTRFCCADAHIVARRPLLPSLSKLPHFGLFFSLATFATQGNANVYIHITYMYPNLYIRIILLGRICNAGKRQFIYTY